MAGVFDQLHRLLLAELHAADALDWTRACVDASHIRAKKGGEATGPMSQEGPQQIRKAAARS